MDPLLHADGADIYARIQRYVKEAKTRCAKPCPNSPNFKKKPSSARKANQRAQQATVEAVTETAEPVSEIRSLQKVRKNLTLQRRKGTTGQPAHRIGAISATETASSMARAAA